MQNENNEKHKAKARRLKALADAGVGGEKENATRMLHDYIKKHKIDISEIDPIVNLRKLRVKDEDDSLILINIILSVNPFCKYDINGLLVYADLDEEDYNEVVKKFRHFIKLFRIEKDLLIKSFFHKHKDAFSPDERVLNKWRDKKKENEELTKAKNKADKINASVNNFPNKQEVDKITGQRSIDLMNLRRMEEMSKILLDNKYTQFNKI